MELTKYCLILDVITVYDLLSFFPSTTVCFKLLNKRYV